MSKPEKPQTFASSFLRKMYVHPDDKVQKAREAYLRGELETTLDPEAFRKALDLPEGWAP